MKKQVRTLQPPHPGARFTMEEAIRAFRQARGSAPKPGIGYDEADEDLADWYPAGTELDDERARKAG